MTSALCEWISAPLSGGPYSVAELFSDNRRVALLDQTRLPAEEVYYVVEDPLEVARAISELSVRGAPAIGIAAAYAMVLAAKEAEALSPQAFTDAMERAGSALRATRPTAVNLAWALGHMLREAQRVREAEGAQRVAILADHARTIHRQDVVACKAIGKAGADLLPQRATVLTHCNAGALATGGYGTALGVVRAAREVGKKVRVFATETRPVLQGARLTCWELLREGIDVTLISDNMVGTLFRQGRVDHVVVGADRIARNGDVANKVGTCAIAGLAFLHGVPVMVAAPWSTVDLSCPDGDAIPIEERDAGEVRVVRGVRIAPEGVPVYNPSFDVTPAAWITHIVTERDVIYPTDLVHFS